MRKTVLFIFVLSACSILSKAQDLNTLKLDSLFAAISNHAKGMGSVSIFKEGKEIYQKSYGFSDVEKGIPNKANTQFRIGSISKTLTATILMKLIEEGKLSLTTRLSDYYPQIPNSGKITIEHLLQHRSGISNFIEVEDYEEWSVKEQTKKQLLKRIVSGGITFEPDEQFDYSNSNYVLLTFIAEDVTSKSFADLLNEIIVVPCVLQHTYIGTKIGLKEKEAYSYTRISGNWVKAKETDMSVPQGSGFIVSTPYDLNRFLSCLFSEKIVKKETLDRMLSLKNNFGLGLFSVPFKERNGYGHTGGIDSFQSNAFYFPESELSITITENGVVYMLNKIITGCLQLYFGEDYLLPEFKDPIEVTSKELEQYLGVYSSPELPFKLTITKKENTLIAQGTGQQALFMECIGKHIFEYEGVNLILEFMPESGKMVLKQFGQEIELSK